MHHPDLEKQLEELQRKKEQAVNNLRDIANEALENADRASKTMMMYLEPAGLKEGCACKGKLCLCSSAKPKPPTSRLFKKLRLKKAQVKKDDKA